MFATSMVAIAGLLRVEVHRTEVAKVEKHKFNKIILDKITSQVQPLGKTNRIRQCTGSVCHELPTWGTEGAGGSWMRVGKASLYLLRHGFKVGGLRMECKKRKGVYIGGGILF